MKSARIAFLSIVAVFCVNRVVAQLVDAPLVEPFEQHDLHTTWRHMANEQVMFPLDMSDIAAQIGSERQLFLDNYLIAAAKGVTRQVRPPDRHKGNPVLQPPRVEMNQIVVQHVLKFDTSPQFRMWYWSWDDWQTLPSGQRIRHGNSYATSDDGVNWERPALNLHKIEGLAEPNNVVVPYGMMQGVFYRPGEPDASKRFQALVLVERKNPTVREGYYIHTSPDGIHWQGDLERPVIPSLQSYGIPQKGIGDTTRFWWDPIRRKYIGDVKFVIRPQTIRCRGVMESDDLVHWTRPTPTFFARADDAEIYGHRGFAYQGMYVGMRWVFLPKYSVRHSSYVELDCSRDGRIWTRVAAGQPYMGFNPKSDTWDATIIRPVSMLEVDDEIWIYYFGAPSQREIENPDYPESAPTDYSMGLATLPRDRFVSIDGGAEAGTLTTRPLHFSGGHLHLNADVAAGGEITVGVLDSDGMLLEEFGESKSLGGDSIDLHVQWPGGSDLVGVSQQGVRFRFRLRHAKLYSFWVSGG